MLSLWQPMLNVAFPLWLVTRTDAPVGLVGILYAAAAGWPPSSPLLPHHSRPPVCPGISLCSSTRCPGVVPRVQQGGEMVRAMAGSGQVPGPGAAPGARTEAAREVLALRNLVAVYRHLSGLAVQNADLAAVTRLISEQTDATVAVVSPTMDILTAAAPGQTR